MDGLGNGTRRAAERAWDASVNLAGLLSRVAAVLLIGGILASPVVYVWNVLGVAQAALMLSVITLVAVTFYSFALWKWLIPRIVESKLSGLAAGPNDALPAPSIEVHGVQVIEVPHQSTTWRVGFSAKVGSTPSATVESVGARIRISSDPDQVIVAKWRDRRYSTDYFKANVDLSADGTPEYVVITMEQSSSAHIPDVHDNPPIWLARDGVAAIQIELVQVNRTIARFETVVTTMSGPARSPARAKPEILSANSRNA